MDRASCSAASLQDCHAAQLHCLHHILLKAQGPIQLCQQQLWIKCNCNACCCIQVILLNGQFPGPTFTAEVGDRIIITFTNRMVNTSASIHMHGMLQRTSNTQDGAVPITQRDVPPGGGA